MNVFTSHLSVKAVVLLTSTAYHSYGVWERPVAGVGSAVLLNADYVTRGGPLALVERQRKEDAQKSSR